jgi:hypothetical protein
MSDGLRAQAHTWMNDHPIAMGLFEELAVAAARRGRKFGAKLLAERIRWEMRIERIDEDYKINNNYVAYVARELIKRHPMLVNFISVRSTGDEA